MTPQTPETHGDASQAPEASVEPGRPQDAVEANSEAKRRAVLRIVFLLPV